VLWLFALGWAVARATTPLHRALLTALTLLTVPGFFGDPRREAVLGAGLLLLTWLPRLPVPGSAVRRVLGHLASASLFVYLTHWLVYPELVALHPAASVGGSLVVGVAYWRLAARLPGALRQPAARLRAHLVARAGRTQPSPRPAVPGETAESAGHSRPRPPTRSGGPTVARWRP
jgi:hypothetical protein